MFTCKEQEFTDANTGVTIALGRHAGSGHHWMRITALAPPKNGSYVDEWESHTTTVTFDGGGEIVTQTAHPVPREVLVTTPAEIPPKEWLELGEKLNEGKDTPARKEAEAELHGHGKRGKK